MKVSTLLFRAGALIGLIGPATADVIYSNLQDIPIPTNFEGVYLDVDGHNGWSYSPISGWDINPFFGGARVANSDAFQPARTGTGNLDPIVDFTVGSTIDASAFFSTGYGGSQTHLGNTFVAGQEGYLGFKLDNADYGWMRVVFTGNGAGAVIEDWAYDNSGAAIVAGRVQQSAAVAGAQLVTLSPGAGESFTLGSTISDTNGNVNSLLKTGDGSTTITGTNTFTGVTTISSGALIVNGLMVANGVVTVGGGGTLRGTGTINGATSVSGTLAPGDGSPGVLTTGAATFNSGSMFQWELDTAQSSPESNRGVAYGGLNTSAVAGGGAVFKIVLTGTQSFTDAFWDTNRTWTDIFTKTGTSDVISNWSSAFSSFQFSYDGQTVAPSSQGYFTLSGSTLTWTAVPEPTGALAGLLLAAGALLRRHRQPSIH